MNCHVTDCANTEVTPCDRCAHVHCADHAPYLKHCCEPYITHDLSEQAQRHMVPADCKRKLGL